jgi:hypothetical protein
LVLILHVGYGWVALSLLALGGSVLGVLPAGNAVHVLTSGAVGAMTLAVMTRASLGHTGRARHAGPMTVVIYGLVNLGAVLVQATGSAAHLRLLAAHAATIGYALSGAALWRGSEFVATPDEATLYGALGLQLVPPELREGRDEIVLAARGALPRLLERADLAGFLHCHTNYSDGTNTVEQLALACREQGYRYIGITDHSQSAAYAGGLRADDLEREHDGEDGEAGLPRRVIDGALQAEPGEVRGEEGELGGAALPPRRPVRVRGIVGDAGDELVASAGLPARVDVPDELGVAAAVPQ